MKLEEAKPEMEVRVVPPSLLAGHEGTIAYGGNFSKKIHVYLDDGSFYWFKSEHLEPLYPLNEGCYVELIKATKEQIGRMGELTNLDVDEAFIVFPAAESAAGVYLSPWKGWIDLDRLRRVDKPLLEPQETAPSPIQKLPKESKMSEFGVPNRKIKLGKDKKSQKRNIKVDLLGWCKAQIRYKAEGIILRFGESDNQAFRSGSPHPVLSFLVANEDRKKLAINLRVLADKIEGKD